VVPTLHTVLREGGVRGLWRGTGPTVVRLAVGAGINFVALEHLKHSMLTALPHASGQLGFMQAAAVGGAWLAGARLVARVSVRRAEALCAGRGPAPTPTTRPY
jgi:solute carrier family 25 protein 38